MVLRGVEMGKIAHGQIEMENKFILTVTSMLFAILLQFSLLTSLRGVPIACRLSGFRPGTLLPLSKGECTAPHAQRSSCFPSQHHK